MKKIKQFFINLICGLSSHKDNHGIFQTNDIFGHPEIIKQAKAADKIFKEMKEKSKKDRINRAKSNEHILRKYFGKEVDHKGFYERNDVIDFIMTSYHFNDPQSKSSSYHSGKGNVYHDDNHSTSHSGGSCSGSSDD